MKKVTVKFNFSNIIWGIVLVAAGVIFALNALDITDIDIFFKGWWTLFIIIPCTINLFTDRDIAGNLFGIALGVVLFLCARDVLEYSMIWKLLLPAFVVIIGLKMLIRGVFGRKDRDDDDDNDNDDEFDETLDENGNPPHTANAIFSAHRLNYDGRVFHSAELNVIFGGAQLDLRNAIIEGDCKVRANCIFGGITILVPDNVNVRVSSSNIFGGCSNKTTEKEGAHTIYITSNSIFGGTSIK